jgi:streptomycin 6-kinase
VPDGDAIVTRSSRLLPVRYRGASAMLKVATETEEKFGAALMVWWDGEGAAKVIAHDGDAILLERARGPRSLAQFARTGRDDEASRIICGVVARLHAPRAKPLPDMIPLTIWFRELEAAAAKQGGILGASWAAARDLLAAPQDVGVLHGDIHHDNILDFGARGWLAIDPKRLFGERGFDYANLFCNPDREKAAETALFRGRVALVAETARLDRHRLLRWILAWAGLSAVWFLSDGDGASAQAEFRIAERAAAELAH